MTEQNDLKTSVRNVKTIWLIAIIVIVASLITTGIAYAWQTRFTPKTIQIYQSFDCDKLKVINITIPKGETAIDTALNYLPSPGGISTVAEYSNSFKIENNIAYIDWPSEMSSLSNIDTSCALQAFLQPIEKTLTEMIPVNAVVHSMGGSANAFYSRMGLSCPQESVECNYDTASIPVDQNFRITNIGNSTILGGPITSVTPIFAYMCDTYKAKDGSSKHYSKIDFFVSKNEKNAPAILLGSTASGSAGSGECDLLEDERTYKSNLEPGKYRVWAVRFINNNADKRTIDNLITLTPLTKLSTITIMVPDNYDSYIKKMTRFAQEGGVNPLVSQDFIKKELTIPFTNNVMKACLEAAIQEIAPSNDNAKISIAYLKVENGTAYTLLNIDLDGWAGSTVSSTIIHPLLRYTLLLFPEINRVVFGHSPS